MRISDWSSDVCSSDLGVDLLRIPQRRHQRAVAAANVQNPRPRRDGPGDQGKVRAQGHARPPVRKPSTTRFSSGHSSRKASWPNGLDSSTKLACAPPARSEEHTSELQSLMRISYAVFCVKKKTQHT